MNDKITGIINILEDVYNRPIVYIGTNSDRIEPFLHGFRCSCSVFGFLQNEEVKKQVIQENDKIYNKSSGYWDEIILSGGELTKIMQEIIRIEIDIWKRSYGDYEDSK